MTADRAGDATAETAVDGPACDTCGKTACPDAALPEFSEPHQCRYAPIYRALRDARDCDYGCGRDYTSRAVRSVVAAVEQINAAAVVAALAEAGTERPEGTTVTARAASSQPAEAPSGDYLATVQDLQRWKREALEVLAGWERVWEALGRPGELGESKHEAALSMLTTQPAEVANGECRCQVVGVTRDPYEPHIPAQYEWEQADGCPVHPLPTPPAEHRRGDDCPQPAEPAATGAVEALADRWADVLAECKESDPRWILDQGVTALDTALRELRTALRVDRAAVAASQPTAAHHDEGLRARIEALHAAADALEGQLGVEGTPKTLWEFRQWLRNRAAALTDTATPTQPHDSGDGRRV